MSKNEKSPFKQAASKPRRIPPATELEHIPTPADLISAGKTPEEPQKVEEVVSIPAESEKPVEKPTGALEDVLNSIKDKKKPAKRSSTLYLSEANLDWLKQKGEEAGGLSSSEYLDQILTMLRNRA